MNRMWQKWLGWLSIKPMLEKAIQFPSGSLSFDMLTFETQASCCEGARQPHRNLWSQLRHWTTASIASTVKYANGWPRWFHHPAFDPCQVTGSRAETSCPYWTRHKLLTWKKEKCCSCFKQLSSGCFVTIAIDKWNTWWLDNYFREQVACSCGIGSNFM